MVPLRQHRITRTGVCACLLLVLCCCSAISGHPHPHSPDADEHGHEHAHDDDHGHPVRRALVVVDAQLCFMPGGALAVPEGDAVVGPLNKLLKKASSLFDLVVFTQDWHPRHHVSFASSHAKKSIGEVVPLKYTKDVHLCSTPYALHPSILPFTTKCSSTRPATPPASPSAARTISQRLWPVHCVANTTQASLHPRLHRPAGARYLRKATSPQIDAYSGFFDNGRLRQTALDRWMHEADIDEIYVAGLALEYSVLWTARDAAKHGFRVFLVEDATKALTAAGKKQALKELGKSKVTSVTVDHIVTGHHD